MLQKVWLSTCYRTASKNYNRSANRIESNLLPHESHVVAIFKDTKGNHIGFENSEKEPNVISLAKE